MLLVSNDESAGCTCCTRESDCDKLEGSAVVKITGYSRAVGQSRCKGRVRIGTVGGKLREGGPGNRTRPPAWESNPAVLVEQLVDELDAVVGARAVVDLHVFGGDDEEGARQNVSCTGRVTLSGGLAPSLWRIGLVRWNVEATVEETRSWIAQITKRTAANVGLHRQPTGGMWRRCGSMDLGSPPGAPSMRGHGGLSRGVRAPRGSSPQR